MVLPGITIGTGAAVGAGTVVTKDIPPFAIAVGNPARITRLRFPAPIVKKLLQIAWWEWPHDRLRRDLADFRTLTATEFCTKHAPQCPPPP